MGMVVGGVSVVDVAGYSCFAIWRGYDAEKVEDDMIDDGMTVAQQRRMVAELLAKRIPEQYAFMVVLYNDDGGATMLSNIETEDVPKLLMGIAESVAHD